MGCDELFQDSEVVVANEVGSPVHGLVLSGGKSRRMGTHKSALVIDGLTLEQRALQTLSSVCNEVYVSVSHGCAEGPTEIADAYPDLGPLGALLSAQARCADAAWLLLAVDMPAVRKKTLQLLLDARTTDADAVVYNSKSGYEPVCAVYEVSSRPVVIQQWRAGQLGLRALLKRLQVNTLRPVTGDLININTPQQWQDFQSGGGPHTA